MKVMKELADVYDLDPGQAVTAGLLHDAAKDLPVEQQQELLREAGIRPYEPASEHDYALYLHGPVGSYLIQKDLYIQDMLVCDAISTHGFYAESANFHHPLSWCLRFSDILEPNRKWEAVPSISAGLPYLRELVTTGSMEKAAVLQTGWLIQMYEARGFPVHAGMREALVHFAGDSGLQATA
jgi:HD superfamily phosphohydrolase YqeK